MVFANIDSLLFAAMLIEAFVFVPALGFILVKEEKFIELENKVLERFFKLFERKENAK